MSKQLDLYWGRNGFTPIPYSYRSQWQKLRLSAIITTLQLCKLCHGIRRQAALSKLNIFSIFHGSWDSGSFSAYCHKMINGHKTGFAHHSFDHLILSTSWQCNFSPQNSQLPVRWKGICSWLPQCFLAENPSHSMFWYTQNSHLTTCTCKNVNFQNSSYIHVYYVWLCLCLCMCVCTLQQSNLSNLPLNFRGKSTCVYMFDFFYHSF